MKKIIITIFVIAILIITGYFLFKGNNQQSKTLSQQPAVGAQAQNTSPESSATQNQAEVKTEVKNTNQEVIYTDSGYSPSQLSIKIGDTVIFKNESSNGMWTASAMHPSHTVYRGTSLQEHCPDATNTSFDECKSAQPGQSWSFTFTKIGTWGYHNHSKALHFGKVIVE